MKAVCEFVAQAQLEEAQQGRAMEGAASPAAAAAATPASPKAATPLSPGKGGSKALAAAVAAGPDAADAHGVVLASRPVRHEKGLPPWWVRAPVA